jgi:hypothetical protein
VSATLLRQAPTAPDPPTNHFLISFSLCFAYFFRCPSAITRGEDLDELGDKSRQLEEDARVFGSRSQQVRRRFCVSYYRTIFVIAIIVIAIVALIIWWATS